MTNSATNAATFQQVMSEKWSEAALQTLSPMNRKKFGEKVCNGMRRRTGRCQATVPPDADSVKLTLTAYLNTQIRMSRRRRMTASEGVLSYIARRRRRRLTPGPLVWTATNLGVNCEVSATAKIAAGGDDKAAYAAVEFLPMDPTCAHASRWLAAKKELQKDIESQRKAQLLGNLESSTCPGFGRKQAAYARNVQSQFLATVVQRYQQLELQAVNYMQRNIPVYSISQLQPGRQLLGGDTGSNQFGEYAAQNPRPLSTLPTGYETYADSSCQ